MNNRFSDNLKKIRKENNLSQEQLADLLGVSRQAVSKWESSTAYPEMDKILALCEKFDINIDDLLHKDVREIKGEDESKKRLNQYIDDFLQFVTDTINMFCDMSFKSRCKCITEQIIIGTIFLTVCLCLGSVCRNMLYAIIYALPRNVYHFVSGVLTFIYISFSFMSTVIIMVHVFKNRYLDYYKIAKENITEHQSEERNESVESIQAKIEDKDTTDTKTRKLFSKKDKQIVIRDPEHSEYRFMNALFKGIVATVKICVLAASSLLFLSLVCLFIAFALSFLLFSTGVLYAGLVSSILSAAVINVILILIVLNFVFNRKNDKKKMIWAFIVSLMVLGFGCGMTMTGILNLEFVTAGQDMMITEYMEFEMKDDIMFNSHYDTIEYIESDNENIRVEYTINKYCDIRNYVNGSMVTLWTEHYNPTGLMKEVVNGLKDKKVITVDSRFIDIKIYTTKENIEKIEKNYSDYYDNEKQIHNTVTSYENRISELEKEIDRYVEKEWNYQQRIEELESQTPRPHNIVS